MHSSRVTVTLPSALFRRLERARRRLGGTRSATVTRAIQEWLDAQEVGEADRRYMEAYLREPEKTAGVSAIAGAVVEGWEPWE